MKAMIGRKIGMTQLFDDKGVEVPVTVIECGPAVVTQIKTQEKDGYQAVQIGFDEMKESRMNKPALGHFKKAGVSPRRRLKEVKVDDVSQYSLGQELKADVFAKGDYVDISGKSKGKGTQGIIRRWNHGRGPESHGSKFHRTPGARSGSSTPGRVFKGQRGPGRMGYVNVTVQNLEVVLVDPERNLMLVKGAVPGPKKGIITIKSTVKMNK